MEGASLNEHVLARFRVTSVSIRSLIVYLHIADSEVLDKQWVDNPERRVTELYALDNGILTFDKVDELRTQAFSLAEDTFLYRDSIVCHLQQLCACTNLVSSLPLINALMVSMVFVSLHVPPSLV